MTSGRSSEITTGKPEAGVSVGVGLLSVLLPASFQGLTVVNYRFKTDTLNSIQTPHYPGQILKSWELGSCKGQ